MAKSFNEWKNKTLGVKIDLDNQSYDCVDVPKSWAEYLTGKPWQQSFCWGNAKDLYNNCPTTYWTKLPKGNKPEIGDVFVMNGQTGGGYGHTGVIMAIDGGNMTVMHQNTFTQQAVFTGVYSWNSSLITGFLRPKVAFTIGDQPTAGYTRTVGAGGVNYRTEPTRNGTVIKLFPQGETLDFKGYVRGEIVENNNTWFVGRYSGGYAWSGGFTDTGTHDLTNLTPTAVTISPTQRQVGPDVMNYRKEPQVAVDNVIRTFNPGEILTFDGWTKGQTVDGNNIWFRGAVTGGYIWSGGMVDSATHDLPEITSEVVVSPPPPVKPPTPAYSFQKDLACVTEVIPAGLGSFEYGRFPAKPTKIVIHDFGTPSKDTITSTINTFKNPDSISAHFVVSGNRIVQMVSLKDRAYHAGPNGNDFVGIESDPVQDEATVASVKLLIKALQLYYGFTQELVKHSSIMPTLCGDDINLTDYKTAQDVKPPEPTPTPTPPPTTPPTSSTLLNWVENLIKSIANWLGSWKR